MNYVAHLLKSEDFAWGIIVTMLLMGILMLYSAKLRMEELLRAHRMEAAIKIGKKFYYIVTEHEWKQVLNERLQKKGFTRTDFSGSDMPFVMYVTKATWKEYYCFAYHGYSSNIKCAKFYWSKEAAEQDSEDFRLLFPLDSSKTVKIVRLDKLIDDSVALKAVLKIANDQREKVHGVKT